MFAKRYFMFSTEYGVNEDVNAIARTFDDRIAMSDLRWNGVSVCLVDDFGKPIERTLLRTQVVGGIAVLSETPSSPATRLYGSLSRMQRIRPAFE